MRRMAGYRVCRSHGEDVQRHQTLHDSLMDAVNLLFWEMNCVKGNRRTDTEYRDGKYHIAFEWPEGKRSLDPDWRNEFNAKIKEEIMYWTFWIEVENNEEKR